MTDEVEQIVQLSQLREIVGDDKELEQSLISMFISSSEENIEYLKNNFKDNEDDLWKLNAHSLKGASRNIGAVNLGDLCSIAQDAFAGSAVEKQDLYLKIQAEFDKVKEFLSNVQ